MVGDFHLSKDEKKETMVGEFDLSKMRKKEATDADFLGGGPGVSTTGVLGSVSQTHLPKAWALYHPLEQIFAAFAGLKSSDQPAALLTKTLFIFHPLQYFSLTQPAATVFVFFFQTSERGP